MATDSETGFGCDFVTTEILEELSAGAEALAATAGALGLDEISKALTGVTDAIRVRDDSRVEELLGGVPEEWRAGVEMVFERYEWYNDEESV